MEQMSTTLDCSY